MTCNEEVIVKYNSNGLPNPVMVFDRDVWILKEDNNLHSSFRILTLMFFKMQYVQMDC